MGFTKKRRSFASSSTLSPLLFFHRFFFPFYRFLCLYFFPVGFTRVFSSSSPSPSFRMYTNSSTCINPFTAEKLE